MSRLVAIVGRPNVGKSTLFNRLTQTRNAIVDEVSGVTRDRHYGIAEWNGKEFSIVDTGGLVTGSDDVFEEAIRNQVHLALDEAAVILFLVDVHDGITPMDEEVADLLRRQKKNVFIVANKADNNQLIPEAATFYALGFEKLFTISSINGAGTGELLDDLVKALPDDEMEPDAPDIPKIAVVGRPNVGKSTLINALLGEERNIVTPIAGTTRDSIMTRYNQFGFDFFLVDTAGIRKKRKIDEDIEFYSIVRSIRTIEYSDVCLLVLDVTKGVETQDMHIFSIIKNNRKGLIILVNKWDLAEKDTMTSKQIESQIRDKIAPFNDVPIIFISALNKQRIYKGIETAVKVYHNRIQKIPTSKLNEVMLPIIAATPPPAIKGKFIKIKFITQLPTHAPSFALFCNLPQYINDPYKRFVENKLRENFDFNGVPIQVFFRKK